MSTCKICGMLMGWDYETNSWYCPKHGTGESEGIPYAEMIDRELNKVDKPEMPNQITNEFGELNAKFIQEAEQMLKRCKELQIHLDCANQLLKTQREEYDKLKANSLPADKVRKEYILLRARMFDLLDEGKYSAWEAYLNIFEAALFPEGVGEQKDKV